jgi:predicted double-glycine peptidase
MRLKELLVVIPHSGIIIPEEIDPHKLSDDFPQMLKNVDWYTNYLYDFRDILGNKQINFPYCSLLLEANRHPDILEDCVPLKDPLGKKMYRRGQAPDESLRRTLSDKYLIPFHDEIRNTIMRGANFMLDGHSTVSAKGVGDDQIELMNYQHSPLDEGPVSYSPPVFIETYAKELRKRLPDIRISINESKYDNVYGHVCTRHSVNALKRVGQRVPAILQETNQKLYMRPNGTADVCAIERLRRAFAEAIYHTLRKVHNIGTGGRILDVPVTRQTYDYDCGAKALQTLLAYYGVDVREDLLMKKLGTSKIDGSSVEEIRTYAKSQGFRVKAHQNMSLGELKGYIDEDYPVLVLLQAWAVKKLKAEEWKTNFDDGHYVIVIGYGKDRVIFEDPSSFSRTWLTEKEFLDRWHDRNPENGKKLIHFGMVLLGREPIGQSMLHME